MIPTLEFVSTLTEGVRTPHPEDFIFMGSQAANDAINGILSAVQNPNAVSIKWDGSPAIIFGRRPADGKFTMNYKEYIAEVGGQVTSAQELMQFYTERGKNLDVAQKLANIFDMVATIVPAGFKGFVQGDLMWTAPLKPQGGKFVFQPNPHGVTYAVGVNSPVGKQIAGRSVGIAVHTYGVDVEKSKESPLVGKKALNGLGGLTGSNEYVTVLTGNMGIQFKVREPVQFVKAATTAVKKYGPIVDEFLTGAGLTASTKNVLQTYYNRKITNQPVDVAWLQAKLSGPQYTIVTSEQNKPALEALDVIWSSIYKLKMAVLEQLEPQVQGVEQYVGGQPKGEGFVIDTPSGAIKLVNRGVFSAANFAGRS